MSAEGTFPLVTGLPAFIVIGVALVIGTVENCGGEGVGCGFRYDGGDLRQS
jgi:hypothetical protein